MIKITDVDDGEVLDAVGDTIQDFILAHAVGVPVFAKEDDYKTFVFGHDGLVDVPASVEMGVHVRHVEEGWWWITRNSANK